ncbi:MULTISPECIES: hypothetical protein [Bacillus]|nr:MULTISPECIES: hypothetical protein [Bacillus]EJT20214.1 hypothetical protein B353_14141 [Bacillus anthracis str. UR-1]ACP17350.1 hypothetical protein BAMEG_5407 [Bacillus anthracis str. CDC 684]ACQ47827.1 hypothetical protein BAA_5384 [Bacillus anthracis str. A0248]AFH86490.1 Hypothetical Protein H9401_5104 [Bacillus anthracis str. H9401]AHE86742.1 hypothetical protein A16R_54290 [Bacillus anthracis str. A16R]
MNEDKHCKASTDTKQDDKEPVKQLHVYGVPFSVCKKLEEKAKQDGLKLTPFIRMKLIQIADEE